MIAAAGMRDFIAVTGWFGIALLVGLLVFLLALAITAKGKSKGLS